MRRLFLLLCFVFPHHAFSNIPEGFEELFVLKETDILITFNDSSTVVPGSIGLGKVTVKKTDETLNKVKSMLHEEYVNAAAVENIVSQLVSGVEDSVHCVGRRDECVMNEEGLQSVQFVVVNEQNRLTIHIPEEYLGAANNKNRYIHEERGENALIMHHDLSISTNAYYKNELTLGMFGGYLHSSISATTDDENEYDSHVYFDELNANYLFESYRLKAGFNSENTSRVWNATNILDIGEKLSVVEISAGTTSELEYKSRKMEPRIYFSIAQSGRLYVTREDGTPILERNVSPGQHYVSYSELPNGISTLRFEVRAGEKTLYEQVHKVYNKANSRLEPGEWDYFVSAGKLINQKLVQRDEVNNYLGEYQNDNFVEFRLASQVGEDITLGLGVLNTPESYLGRVALNYNPYNKISFNILYGLFDDESRYWQSDVRLGDLTLSTSRLDERSRENWDKREKVTFGNYLLGYGSERELSANYGTELGAGRMYISYSKVRNESVKSTVFKNIDEVFNVSEFVNIGYTFGSFYNSTVDISGSYHENEDVNGFLYDNWSLSASVSIPIGSSGYITSGIDSNDGNQSYNASVGNSYSISENSSLSAEFGTSQSQEMNSYYASLSGNYDNDKFNSNVFLYSDGDSNSISGSLSGSTIVTKNNVYQTNEKADSYLIVENKALSEGNVRLEDEQLGDFFSIVNVKKNGSHEGRVVLDSDIELYPLDSYREYAVNLDEEASDYYNIGSPSVEASSYPGSLLNLDVDMREVKTYISVFNDIEGNPVNTMQCNGQGCIDVEEVTEGVFKFRISAGLPFELRTSSQRCLIPPPHLFSTYNLGENFCMPGFEEEGELRLSRGENGIYYYVGEYDDNEFIAGYESSLSNEPIKFIKKSVGERIFLFVESSEQLTMKQKQVIESLSQYALEETINRPMFVSR